VRPSVAATPCGRALGPRDCASRARASPVRDTVVSALCTGSAECSQCETVRVVAPSVLHSQPRSSSCRPCCRLCTAQHAPGAVVVVCVCVVATCGVCRGRAGAAFAAGAASSSISTPAELLMIQQQRTGESLWVAARRVGMRQLYRGLVTLKPSRPLEYRPVPYLWLASALHPPSAAAWSILNMGHGGGKLCGNESLSAVALRCECVVCELKCCPCPEYCAADHRAHCPGPPARSYLRRGAPSGGCNARKAQATP